MRSSVGPALGQVGHGGGDQGRLGGVVVQLGAPGDAGPGRDHGGGGAGPAVLDQAVDGRLQQPGLGGAAALLLRDAGRCGGHGDSVPPAKTNSQA